MGHILHHTLPVSYESIDCSAFLITLSCSVGRWTVHYLKQLPHKWLKEGSLTLSDCKRLFVPLMRARIYMYIYIYIVCEIWLYNGHAILNRQK